MHRVEFAGSGGVTIAGDRGGDPTHPCVVFMHGGGQTRHSWGGTAERMIELGYYVVSLDARGHGESSWAPDGRYELDDFIGDLRSVLAHLPGRPALVGASLGGVTSLVAIGESEAPVASALVMVDVTPRIAPQGAAAIGSFMSANPDGFADIDEAAEAVARYLPHRPRPRDVSGLRRNLREGTDGRLYWHWDPVFLAGRRERPLADHRRMVEAATRVTVPTLLVRGCESEIVTGEAVDEFRALIPSARVVEIPGAHHMVAGDRNGAVGDAVVRFLGDTVATHRERLPAVSP